MPSFFFSLLWLVPDFEQDICGDGHVRVHRRQWDVAIFDLYSLVAERHRLRLPAELMHVFLQLVNLEVEVVAENFASAADRLDQFRAMLCLQGIAPSVAPFAANYSLNAYAGINARSAGHQAQMHEGLRQGITHKTARIETWPHELSFACIEGPGGGRTRKLDAPLVLRAIADQARWHEIETAHPAVRAARRAFVKAPLMPDLGSSILQIWQGIEGLFDLHTETTFRASLLLAELNAPVAERTATYERAKRSYKDRSQIAHGSQKAIDMQHWQRAYRLLSETLQAILARAHLPAEDELTRTLLRHQADLHPSSGP